MILWISSMNDDVDDENYEILNRSMGKLGRES